MSEERVGEQNFCAHRQMGTLSAADSTVRFKPRVADVGVMALEQHALAGQ